MTLDGQNVQDIVYAADGQVTRTVYTSGTGDIVQTTDYDIRRRPVRTQVTRTPDPEAEEGTLSAVTRLVDQQLTWDVASNLTAVVDDRDPAEWPAGFRPQTVHVEHDSLYRVVGAQFDYTQDNGSRSPTDTATNYRETFDDILQQRLTVKRMNRFQRPSVSSSFGQISSHCRSQGNSSAVLRQNPQRLPASLGLNHCE